jgi:hypothetical protein
MTEFFEELDAETLADAMQISFDYGADPGLKYYELGETRRSFLDITWLLVDLFAWSLVETPLWANVTGGEVEHWDP